MKTLVLGLGNPILTDDGVGIHVVRATAAQCPLAMHITCAEASVGGMRLLDLLAGYERVFLVDAIQTRDGEPGQIYTLGPGDLRGRESARSTQFCGPWDWHADARGAPDSQFRYGKAGAET